MHNFVYTGAVDEQAQESRRAAISLGMHFVDARREPFLAIVGNYAERLFDNSIIGVTAWRDYIDVHGGTE